MKNTSIGAKSGASIDLPKSSGIRRDDWLKALGDAGISTEDDPTAITIGEFGALFGMSISVSRRHLDHLVSIGKATRTHKRQLSITGKMVNYVAFRLTK